MDTTTLQGSDEMPLCKVVSENALSHDFPAIRTFIGLTGMSLQFS